MEIKIENITVQTVLSTYSWDSGSPSNANVIEVTPLSSENYFCYAPVANVLLSASIVNPHQDAITFKRTVDFGDFYNTETNTQTTNFSGNFLFCHNYIMPGTYTVTLSQTQYIPIYYEDSSYTYRESAPLAQTRSPFSWMWYNFFCKDTDRRLEFVGSVYPRQEHLTWDDCVFQGKRPLTWEDIADDPIEVVAKNVSWTWKCAKKISDNPLNQRLQWADAKRHTILPRTWSQIRKHSCLEIVPSLSANTITMVKEFLITVLDTPPTAYLEVMHTNKNSITKESPCTVLLSPRNIRCGSFPIEKLIWDFGDGSPILEQTRRNVITEYPFTYSDEFSYDAEDPRNYDVYHTYYRTKTSGNCFYPSITAISASTGKSDCASAVVGPLKYQPHQKDTVRLLQNKLTDDEQVLYVGQVNSNVSFWKS
jgi:hypothetical protein